MMIIAQIMEKMIAFSEGNIHDITHLSCMWTYAKTIGELEGLDADTQFILEVAAITHDIACPLCRKKYGNTNGKYQEQGGGPGGGGGGRQANRRKKERGRWGGGTPPTPGADRRDDKLF